MTLAERLKRSEAVAGILRDADRPVTELARLVSRLDDCGHARASRDLDRIVSRLMAWMERTH